MEDLNTTESALIDTGSRRFLYSQAMVRFWWIALGLCVFVCTRKVVPHASLDALWLCENGPYGK